MIKNRELGRYVMGLFCFGSAFTVFVEALVDGKKTAALQHQHHSTGHTSLLIYC